MRWSLPPIAALCLLPASALAQTPVHWCSRECEPTDIDVNPSLVEGPGTARVILYAHMDSILGYVPLNAERVNAATEPPLEETYLVPTLATRTGTPVDLGFTGYPVTLFPTAGGYERKSGVGYLETGLQFPPALVLGDGPIVLYAYFGVDSVPDPYDSVDAGALARVRFEARWLKEVRHDDPALLAWGATATSDLLQRPDGAQVYEVRIEMQRTSESLDGCAYSRCAFVVKLSQIDTPNARFVQRDWKAYHRADMPWRVILPVRDPLEGAEPELAIRDGRLIVAWQVRASLGSYDLNRESAWLSIDRAGTVSRYPSREVRESLDHGAPVLPAKVTWRIPLEDLREPGTPKVAHLSVDNLQGTFRLTHELALPHGLWGEVVLLPSVGPGLFLVAVLGLVLMRRRGH